MLGTDGNAVDVLVDDELWPRLTRAIAHARHEILVTQLLFGARFRVGERPLSDELEAAARRGADVRILVNENAAIPDSYDELAERFDGTGVEVVRLLMTPNVMHAKLVIVDATEAFVVDPPFEQKYLDKSLHAYGPTRGRDKPVHSVSARVRGPAVAGLRGLVARLLEVAAARPLAPAPPPARAGSLGVRIARTAPAGVLDDAPTLEIVEEYERAIGAAKRFVYLENQYFTSPRIRDAIGRALAREPALEVILLVNVHMDVPGYDAWAARRLDELTARDHPRLSAFALWAPRRTASDPAARAVYIHSKSAVIDDAWCTIGSANLDSISLHEAEEFPTPAPLAPNVEANLVIEDRAFATSLRRRLWAEHLGDDGMWRADAPVEGWLARWRAVAEENVRRLEDGDAARVGKVFPWHALPNERRERLFGARRG